jgi:hypothetical protein
MGFPGTIMTNESNTECTKLHVCRLRNVSLMEIANMFLVPCL